MLRLIALGVASTLRLTPLLAQQPAACARPPARPVQAGETIVVKDPSSIPCRIQFTPTRVALHVDPARQVSAIIGTLSRAPDGRFVSGSGRGSFTVWSAQGEPLKTIGTPGRGNGQFAAGQMYLLFDAKGRLFVADNNVRWTIYSPSLEFVRAMTAAGMGHDPRRAALLPDGTLLTASTSVAKPNTFFQVYDFDRMESRPVATSTRGTAPPPVTGPAIVRAFGPVSPVEATAPPIFRERFISYAGRETFWAGPPASTGRGYELELWSTKGTKLRTIRREASWFPPGADATPALPQRGKPPARPPAQVIFVHEDGTGLLYVGVVLPNARWGAVPVSASNAERAKRIDEMADMRIEVIDGNAGVLLAATEPMPRSRALAEYALGMFPGTRMGYRPAAGTALLQGMQIVEYTLIARQ